MLQNFGYYLAQKSYAFFDVVIAWLVEIRDVLASSGRTVIFLGPDFDVPAALVNDVTTVDFPLPDDTAIETSVRFVADGQKLSRAALPGIVSACRGMTQQQVEDRTVGRPPPTSRAKLGVRRGRFSLPISDSPRPVAAGGGPQRLKEILG